MAVLKFSYQNVLPCSGIFAKGGDPKGWYVPDKPDKDATSGCGIDPTYSNVNPLERYYWCTLYLQYQ